jgi:hypothetical protein
MVVGHVSIAYLTRAREPRAEMLALVIASLLPDFADFVLPQGNQCRTSCGLYTHAFPAFLVLALAAGALAWGIWHRRATALMVAAMIVAHVLCDLLTGHKPMWFGGPPVGLALYRFQPLDFALESAMAIAGWVLLRRERHAPRWAVQWVTLVALIAVQGAFDVWHFKKFGRPPATSTALVGQDGGLTSRSTNLR